MEDMFFSMGLSMGGQPEVTADADCSIVVALDDGLLARKAAAVRAQVSQTEALTSAIPPTTFAAVLGREMFRPAV
jgi:hypothetical protein